MEGNSTNTTIDKLQTLLTDGNTYVALGLDASFSISDGSYQIHYGMINITNRMSSFSIIETLAEIEYEKMVTHNPDGSISLNSEYIASLFQQEALQGFPNQIIATYLALIKTFETIETSDDMETFLNSCYIKREISVPNASNYTGGMNSAYEFFNRKAISQVKGRFEYSLSPVFTEMMQYYTNTVIPSILDELYSCEDLFTDRAIALKSMLTRSGILQNLAVYGNQTYSWQVGNKPVKPITVQMDENGYKFEMQIASSKPGVVTHNIVQYRYSSSLTNAFNGKDIGKDYIKSTLTTWQQYIGDQSISYGIDKLIDGLGLLCPVYAPTIAGSASAIKFISGIIETAEENSAAQNAIAAMNFTDAMAAFGLDGQLCTVDGQLQCQYLHLDSVTFLKNFAAYNAYLDENHKSTQTIDMLCSSSETVREYVKFCNKGGYDGAGNIQHYVNENENVDALIEKYVNQSDRDSLEPSLAEQIKTLIGDVQ